MQEEQQAGADSMTMTLGVTDSRQFNTIGAPPYKKSHSLQRPNENRMKNQHGGVEVRLKQLSSPQKNGKIPRFPANATVGKHHSLPQSGFLPPAIQTTASYSPDFAQVVKRDTRPDFLGGQYKSKVQGRSEVT